MFKRVQRIQFQFSFLFLFFFWSSKMLFCSLQLFANGHIHSVVSRLINIVKLDVENSNVVLTLSKVVNINVEINNVGSTSYYVVNSIVDIHNVVSTLIWRCPTSERHINLKTTLKQRWNVWWVVSNLNIHARLKAMKKKNFFFIIIDFFFFYKHKYYIK